MTEEVFGWLLYAVALSGGVAFIGLSLVLMWTLLRGD